MQKRAEEAVAYADPLPQREPIAGTVGSDTLSAAIRPDGESADVTVVISGWFERDGLRYFLEPTTKTLAVKLQKIGDGLRHE